MSAPGREKYESEENGKMMEKLASAFKAQTFSPETDGTGMILLANS